MSKACPHFARGSCKFGDACKYAHEESDKSLLEVESSMQKCGISESERPRPNFNDIQDMQKTYDRARYLLVSGQYTGKPAQATKKMDESFDRLMNVSKHLLEQLKIADLKINEATLEISKLKDSHSNEVDKLRQQYHDLLYERASSNAHKVLGIFCDHFLSNHEEAECESPVENMTIADTLRHFMVCKDVDESFRNAVRRVTAGSKHESQTRKSLPQLSPDAVSQFRSLFFDIEYALDAIEGYLEIPYFSDESVRRLIAAFLIDVGREVRYRTKNGGLYHVEEDMISFLPTTSDDEEELPADSGKSTHWADIV